MLANQLPEKERIDLQIDEPFFSPNLQMWSTPLNSKILVTGSIGVDPKLVELKSNYPRYNMLISNSEKEEDILRKIRKKAERMENILGGAFETDPKKETKKTAQRPRSTVKQVPRQLQEMIG